MTDGEIMGLCFVAAVLGFIIGKIFGYESAQQQALSCKAAYWAYDELYGWTFYWGKPEDKQGGTGTESN